MATDGSPVWHLMSNIEIFSLWPQMQKFQGRNIMCQLRSDTHPRSASVAGPSGACGVADLYKTRFSRRLAISVQFFVPCAGLAVS